MTDMEVGERFEIQDRREIEYRQWTHDELAEDTAAYERALVDVLYKLESVDDRLSQEEIAEAYRDGDVLDLVDEL